MCVQTYHARYHVCTNIIIMLVQTYHVSSNISFEYKHIMCVNKQAWAELCQAQKKQRLAKLDLPVMKLYLSSIKKLLQRRRRWGYYHQRRHSGQTQVPEVVPRHVPGVVPGGFTDDN